MIDLLSKNKQHVLGMLRNKQYTRAQELCRNMCDMHKDDAGVWVMMGGIEGMLGAYDRAEACCRRALNLNPVYADAHYNLGNILNKQGRKVAAAESYKQAIQCRPGFAHAYYAYGNVQRELMNHDLAVESFRKYLEIEPNSSPGYTDLGNAYIAQGRIQKAIACFRKVLTIDPENRVVHASILGGMNYDTSCDAKAVLNEHRAYAGQLEDEAGSVKSYSNKADHCRRIRVGYVSPDFYQHSVAYFIEPVLERHDIEKVETFCYSDVKSPDLTTERLERLSNHWRNTSGMNDQQVDSIIRNDSIDILVDLAGYSLGNRMSLFARKPAPIQVSYLGYPATTGLVRMDYRLTDSVADPFEKADCFYTENLVRMPAGFLCYKPPDEAPDVEPTPAIKNGYFTFGSFNNLAKCSSPVIRLWSSILGRVPESRIIIKSHRLTDQTTCNRLYKKFSDHGVSQDRVELIGMMPSLKEHLSLYSAIDIALDTFPYNGVTTTCEALWMGVPVITLHGSVHSGRMGASLLGQVGLSGYIADTQDEYINIAEALTGDLNELAQLRNGLRERIAGSGLLDSVQFVRKLEDAYRSMWKKWCDAK